MNKEQQTKMNEIITTLQGKEFKRKGLRKQMAEALDVDFYDIELVQHATESADLHFQGFVYYLKTEEVQKDTINYIIINKVY